MKNKIIVFIVFLFSICLLFLVYRRLNSDVLKVLIVGDSIGEGAGTSDPAFKWYKYLIPYMKDTYGVELEITNVSMGGNTSYAGYARVMKLNDEEKYDLAIICYGENDQLEDFSLYYESILRAINLKYPSCKLMTILESSQRDYTEKIRIIQGLSEHYGAYVADTIAAFKDSGRPYEELCDDGTHPNDEGQKVYFETVKVLMDTFYAQREQDTVQTVEPVNQEVLNLDNFQYYSINDFKQVDKYTYELEIALPKSMLGIDYTRLSGENHISIYIDGEKACDKRIVCDNDYRQRFIEKVIDQCEINSGIQIVFSTEEQMENFYGIIVSIDIEHV